MNNLSIKTLALYLQSETACSPDKAETAAREYVLACYKQILKHIHKHTDNYYYVSMNTLRRELGDITVGGTRYYPFNIFQAGRYRILTTVELGNNINGKLTMTKLNYDFDQMEQIIIAGGNSGELVDYLYRTDELTPLQIAACERVPIDTVSLQAFLRGNANIPRDGSARARKADLYALYARRILMIAADNKGYMPHFPNESKFGRKYYHGPNLQNTPAIVRGAALGRCHEYDIESSVFAWKLSLVKQIAAEMGGEMFSAPATLEYLDHKAALRERLTQQVFDTTNTGYTEYIKQAITAIGFGAPLRGGGYKTSGGYEPMALAECITSTALLNKFLALDWVKAFGAEQAVMNTIIVEYVIMLGMRDELLSIPELVNGRGSLKPNSVISYLYQQSERKILDTMIEHCQDREVLLTVHDCFYTRLPVKLAELRYELKQIGEFFDVSHEEHRAFKYDTTESEHRLFIKDEERRVAVLYGVSVHDPEIERKKVEAIKEFASNYHGDWDCHDGKCYDGSNRNEAWSMANYDRDLDPFYDEEDTE